MTDIITNELVLEHLKAIQAKLSNHDQRFDNIEVELRAMNKILQSRFETFGIGSRP